MHGFIVVPVEILRFIVAATVPKPRRTYEQGYEVGYRRGLTDGVPIGYGYGRTYALDAYRQVRGEE